MRAVLLIAGNDLRQRLRDKSLLIMAILVPLGLTLVLNLVFGGLENEEIAAFAVADQDNGPVATQFTGRVLGALEREGVVDVRRVRTPEEGRALTEEGAVAASISIPPGFSQAVQAGRPAVIRIVGHVDRPVGVQVARSVVEAFAAELRYVQIAVATAGGPPERVAGEAAQAPAPVRFAEAEAARRQLDIGANMAAGMAVFFLFFTVQFGVTSILDERRDGTLARLVAAPIPRSAILAGKLLSSVVVGTASMAVLLVASGLILGVTWGDPLGVAALVLAGVLAATGVMGVVATFARNAEQAGGQQSVVAVLLGLLGGVFLPVAQLGAALSVVSLATPHRWFLRGLSELADGGGPGRVAVPVLALLAFALVTGAIAMARVGRMLRP
ncbi:ABC transporter permease [Bailinhaonella thermotolerans]|uniref:ABC transporter permease n=1 Tax=Bailinhaonella thermotolerans TaxID=1070861 RepID=A0A3A4BGI1_9ACTN|nr:ABC transporter permease [Bailinhaonella thermotolerans]RJL30412.1 ABC transporter permease [Bailinhaonella thermotolerans]